MAPVAWTIVEIETAAPGWRTRGAGGEDGAPVALWALVENEVGERVVVGANFLIDAESNLRAALQAFTAPKEGALP